MEFSILENCGHLFETEEPLEKNEKQGSLLPPEVQEKAEQLDNLSESEKTELQTLEKANNERLLPMHVRERLMELRNKSVKK